MSRRRKQNREAKGTQSEPASPCIDVCVMDPQTELCKGCLRHIDEIAKWSTYSKADKRRVLERIEERKARRS